MQTGVYREPSLGVILKQKAGEKTYWGKREAFLQGSTILIHETALNLQCMALRVKSVGGYSKGNWNDVSKKKKKKEI